MITCTFETGATAHLRHVTVDCLIIQDREILLVKRAAHFLEGGKYALPGGYLNPGETTEEGAMREAQEETGYEIELDYLLHVNDDPHRKHDVRQNVTFYYVAHAREKVQDPDDESTDVRWFPVDDLPPREQMAFDHYDEIQLYKKHGRDRSGLPCIGAIPSYED